MSIRFRSDAASRGSDRPDRPDRHGRALRAAKGRRGADAAPGDTRPAAGSPPGAGVAAPSDLAAVLTGIGDELAGLGDTCLVLERLFGAYEALADAIRSGGSDQLPELLDAVDTLTARTDPAAIVSAAAERAEESAGMLRGLAGAMAATADIPADTAIVDTWSDTTGMSGIRLPRPS